MFCIVVIWLGSSMENSDDGDGRSNRHLLQFNALSLSNQKWISKSITDEAIVDFHLIWINEGENMRKIGDIAEGKNSNNNTKLTKIQYNHNNDGKKQTLWIETNWARSLWRWILANWRWAFTSEWRSIPSRFLFLIFAAAIAPSTCCFPSNIQIRPRKAMLILNICTWILREHVIKLSTQ